MKIGDIVDMTSCATVQGLSLPERAPPGCTFRFLYLGMETPESIVNVNAILRGELPVALPREGIKQ